MKKTLLLTILFCFALSSFAFAQNKIAIVDIQLIMQQSKAGVKAVGELETLQKNSISKVQAKKSEVEKLAADINKQKASLSQTALQNKNIELNKKSVELERLQNDLNAEFQNTYAMKVEEVARELEPVLNDYAKEKGFDIVFIKQPGVMAYASDTVDITSDVISRFDIKWSKKGTK